MLLSKSRGARFAAPWLAGAIMALSACGDGTLTETLRPTQRGTLNFCAAAAPLWVAVKDGDGPWTRVTGTGAAYAFAFHSGKGGFAWVTRPEDGGAELQVLYTTTAELIGSSSTVDMPCRLSSTRSVNGTLAGMTGPGSLAFVGFGGASLGVFPSGPTFDFTLDGVSPGAHDLLASYSAQPPNTALIGTPPTMLAMIIRRDLNPSSGGTLDVIDFTSPEAFAPASAKLTVGGLGTSAWQLDLSLLTANGTSAWYFYTPVLGSSASYYGVPAAKLRAGDLHSLTVYVPVASEPAPQVVGTGGARQADLYFRSTVDRSVTLGPALGNFSIDTIATAPYLRLRAQLPRYSEYNQLGEVDLYQGSANGWWTTTVVMTAAYAGSGVYDLVVPDLSAAGFDPSWGLRPDLPLGWEAWEVGGTFPDGVPGRKPADGATIVSAYRRAMAIFVDAPLGRRPHPRLQLPLPPPPRYSVVSPAKCSAPCSASAFVRCTVRSACSGGA